MKRKDFFNSARLFLIVLAGTLIACDSGTISSSTSTYLAPGPSSPRLVILYATCTLNKNYLSPYNSDITFTPNLEKFAGESIVFKNHFTESGQSGTTFASIFSGTQADKHGVFRHPTRMTDEPYLISEAFADAGYETFFWNGHGMASPSLNYGQGVDKKNTFRSRILTASDPEFIKILEKLNSDKNYRAFIVTNFTLTHGRYETINFKQFTKAYPSEAKSVPKAELKNCANKTRSGACNKVFADNIFQLRYDFLDTVEKLKLSPSDISDFTHTEELIYKSNVNYLDHFFGSLVGQLSRYEVLEESLVAFTSDHGEVQYRDNSIFKFNHGQALDPEVLHVPFIVHAPTTEIPPGTYEGNTRSIDVFPTILGLAGIPLPEGKEVDGVDLSPVLRGLKEPPDLYAYSHTTVPLAERMEDERYRRTLRGRLYPSDDPLVIWVAIRDDTHVYKWRKYLDESWGYEVYDTINDPDERTNLFEAKNHDHQQMASLLRQYKMHLVEAYMGTEEMTPEQAEKIRLLKSLGYIQ